MFFKYVDKVWGVMPEANLVDISFQSNMTHIFLPNLVH